jgi:membrane-bound lytic murein transglycosylase A
VRLDWIDGSESTTLAVAATNGHDYVSLGRLAIDAGLASENEMSLARLRTLHETHEAELAALMLENPRFIMFRALDDDETLRGKRGETIVGFVSLAADDAHDTGAVILIEPLDGGEPFLGLVHDGGAAIQGPARFDRYFGASDEALRQAGEVQSPIRAWRVVFAAEKTSPKKR